MDFPQHTRQNVANLICSIKNTPLKHTWAQDRKGRQKWIPKEPSACSVMKRVAQKIKFNPFPAPWEHQGGLWLHKAVNMTLDATSALLKKSPQHITSKYQIHTLSGFSRKLGVIQQAVCVEINNRPKLPTTNLFMEGLANDRPIDTILKAWIYAHSPTLPNNNKHCVIMSADAHWGRQQHGAAGCDPQLV